VAEVNLQLDPLQQITGVSAWHEAEFPRTTTLKVRKFLVREQLLARRAPNSYPAFDRLTQLVAGVTGSDPATINEESCLVSGLGLTSIGRLELVTAIEREFRLDLDESLIGPATTLAGLRAMITARAGLTATDHSRFWVNTPPVRLLRRAADTLVHRPLISLFTQVEARGLHHLAGLSAPVIFVSNHVSYLDQPCVMAALPPAWRYRTATAAWAEFFFSNWRTLPQRIWKRLCYEYCSLFVNVFPLPQTSGFRQSLRFMGRLADNGINLLVFPEGERTMDGSLLPFRHGLGIMAAELGIPVVPLRTHGLVHILPRGAGFPHRGPVVVNIGAPLVYRGEDQAAFVARVRAAIEAL
jgi:long-chain acyl-CoA synthetase